MADADSLNDQHLTNLGRPAEMEQDGRRARQHDPEKVGQEIARQRTDERLSGGNGTLGIKTLSIRPGGPQ